MIDLSVVVVSYNNSDEVNTILSKVREMFDSTNLNVQYIVSDNSNSVFYKASGYGGQNVVIVGGQGNSGFAIGANRGASVATGRNILFLNSDVIFSGLELVDLYNTLETIKNKAIVAPLLCPVSARAFAEEKIDISASFNDMSSSGGDYHFRVSRILQKLGLKKRRFSEWEEREISISSSALEKVDWVAGTVMMMSRDTFCLGEGFSASYFMYFEDVDFCWRLSSLGIRSFIDTRVVVGHRESGHTTTEQLLRKNSNYRVSRNRFLRKAAPLYLRGFFPFLDLQ